MSDPRLDPHYYLQNFSGALRWLAEIYPDLLSSTEQAFIDEFDTLPVNAQALLVRLIMRKRDCFRSSKIHYPEIGDIRCAAAPLIDRGYIDDEPLLSLSELFELLRREEINELFDVDASARKLTKPALLAMLLPLHLHERSFESWRGATDECAYRVLVSSLCAHFELLFFGSFHQNWSEFVLTDLGIFKYEPVELGPKSRGFQSREDIQAFYRIYRCRDDLHRGRPLDDVIASLPAEVLKHSWLETRRAKLLFQIAHRYEGDGETARALAIYQQSTYAGARLRTIRLLERSGLEAEALELALEARASPESAAEMQALDRVIPRLLRTAGVEVVVRAQAIPPEMELCLDLSHARVEECVQLHLGSSDAPVVYVENALITSLFGLLFWDAIFAPVPGAFFHRFHSAPMDLYDSEFVRRRQQIIDSCFAKLETRDYQEQIRRRFVEKAGTTTPFVAWSMLDERILELALLCIPSPHLKLFFQRILDDIHENCTGLPDLIQFWPAEQRYRLIEVKGPGDRLQDHQQRWIRYFLDHDIPICVAYVTAAQAQA